MAVVWSEGRFSKGDLDRWVLVDAAAVAAWRWISFFVDFHGVAPTTSEIAAGVPCSRSQAWRYLLRLESWGLIETRVGGARGWVLVVFHPDVGLSQ